jgi:RNA polymerase sigma-70 factor (ECF subfamily)
MSSSASQIERIVFDAAESTSTDLLGAARRMDAEAWKTILNRYSWLVFHWCRTAGINPVDSADIVQTVFAQIAKSLSRFKKDGKKAAFRRWLATITRRRIIDFRRSEANQPRGQGGELADRKIRLIPENQAMSSDGSSDDIRREQLWKIVDRLETEVDGKTWEAFWLTTIENLSSTEVASELGMTSNAVRLAKARVLQRLRAAVAGDDDALLRS